MFSIINTGLTSSQRDLSVTANNLANSNTVGFKKSKSNFVDIFANDPTSNPRTAVGSGTMMATVDKDMSQGSMTSTGRVTDLAIAGKGFFTLGSLGSQPKPVIIPTFSGLGLSPATWPALPQPPVYPTVGPIIGSGLTSVAWVNPPQPPSPFIPFNGLGLPTTTAQASEVGMPNGSYAITVQRANDQLDVNIDGTTVKSFIWDEFGGSTHIQLPGQTKTYDFSNDLNDEGSNVNVHVQNTVINVSNWYEYTYALTKDGVKGPTQNYEFNQSTPGVLSHDENFQSTAYVDPTKPDQVVSTTAWSANGNSGTVKNVYQRLEGTGAGTKGGFIGRSEYISFGGDGTDGERLVTLEDLDASFRKAISFDYISGNRTNGGDTPAAADEHLDLMYSVDGGVTYEALWSSTSITPLPVSWTSIVVDLPTEARTANVNFKFLQPNSSGVGNDTHGIANLTLTDLPPEMWSEPTTKTEMSPKYNWIEGTIGGSATNVFVRSENIQSNNDKGGFSGQDPYIIFGSNGQAGERSLVIDDLNLSHNAAINFNVRRGSDTNGAEQPDAPIEDLKLYFSIDGGSTYNLLKSFDSSDAALSNWTNISVSLPLGAKQDNVKLKFEQAGSSGPEYDHWAISNITFSNDVAPPVTEPATVNSLIGTPYEWQLGDYKGSAQNVFTSSQGLGVGNNTPFNGRQPYVTFGGGGVAGQRILTYPPLDLRSKSSIQLDVIAGNNTNGGDTSNTGELLYIEYSTDGGKSFKQLANFENSDSSLNNWSEKSITLPQDANAENVQIRFRQEGSSGPQYDHWGLANISFVDKASSNSGGDTRVYTRAGNFSLDKEGYLTSSTGLRVLGTNVSTKNELEAIQILSTYNGSPLAGVDINSAGRITTTYGDGTVRELYDLAIASFANDSALKQIGNTQFTATGDSGTAKYLPAGKGGGTIMAATLEQSNTDITGELMNMLRTQQNYNANARMLQAYVEVASRLTDKI